MKLLKTICALTAFALLGGCIKEDMSDCPPDVNTSLTFSYTGDENDPTMFGKMIDRVDLFVFDRTSGQHILTKTVGEADLRAFQGTDLYLPGGDYKIITWGNAFDNTEILHNGSLTAGRVHAPAFNMEPQRKISTNDHLYYGVYDITVPAIDNMPQSVTGNIQFHGAHINIEIYIKNFGHANDLATYPVVEMTNLMPQYDMQKTAVQPFGMTYYPMVVWDSNNAVMAARFQVLHFTDLNTISVVVREPAPDNTVKATVDLMQYMLDNNISVNGRNEATVSLLIEFTDLGITVTIPDWGSGDIDPDI